jgi:hypothetical protein
MYLARQPNGDHRASGFGAAAHRAWLGLLHDSAANDSSIDHHPDRRDIDNEFSSSVESHIAPGRSHDHAANLNPAKGIVSYGGSMLSS